VKGLLRPRVLLVDDDRKLVAMLTGLLGEEGYDVSVAHDGQTALLLALGNDYDVVILDRGLPFIEGLDLLSRLRYHGWSTPVLILSAYGAPRDRVAGLDAGAEDYLVKPFDVEELLARVRALRRRHHDTAELLPVVGGLLDLPGRQVRLDRSREPVALSSREAELLSVLARRPRRVFTRDELRSRVFEDAEADSIVDTYVHYLRRKLGRGIVRTVHGVGYQAGDPSRQKPRV
jgi:DNA-binding response OmpR family regulator